MQDTVLPFICPGKVTNTTVEEDHPTDAYRVLGSEEFTPDSDVVAEAMGPEGCVVSPIFD